MKFKIFYGNGWADVEKKVSAWLATQPATIKAHLSETRMHLATVKGQTSGTCTVSVWYD